MATRDLGDRRFQEPFSFYFNTLAYGSPTAFDASPARTIKISKPDGSETSTGATITEDVNLTGLHRIDMVTTDAFYVDDEDYSIRLEAGKVSGLDLANLVLADFSINKVTPEDTWYVSTGGNDANGGRSRNDAFLTLGAAIAAASDGHTIFVADGLYQPSAKITINKAVHIIGDSMLGTKIAADKNNTTLEITVDGVSLSYLTVQCDKAVDEVTPFYAIDMNNQTNCKLDHCFLWGFRWATTLNCDSCTDSEVRQCIVGGESTVLDIQGATNLRFYQCRIQNQSNKNVGMTKIGMFIIESDTSAVVDFNRCTINCLRTNTADVIDEIILLNSGKILTFHACDLIAGASDPGVIVNFFTILETRDTTDSYILSDSKINAHNAQLPGNILCIRAEGGAMTLDNCSVVPDSISGDFKNKVYMDAGVIGGYD